MSALSILDRPSPLHPHRRVVLVDLPWTRDKDPRLPLGHASILASLRGAGIDSHSVVRPVNSPDFSTDSIVDSVLQSSRGKQGRNLVIAVGAYVWSEPWLQELLPRFRSTFPDALLVVGGPQVTFADCVSGLYPDAHCLVRGAGEHALLALTQADRGARIPGVSWRDADDEGGQARVDLDSLPSPFLNGTTAVRRGGFVRWEPKRGCRFACNFCQHRNPDSREFQRLPEGRLRAELALFAERQVADIAVLDPIFNDGSRSTAVLEECDRLGLTARLSLQSRLEMVTEDFLEAGRSLDLRLEFGLQTIHPKECQAVGRPNNMAVVERRLARVRTEGHPFEISLIYGLPNQTLESFRESVEWCLNMGVPTIKAFPLMLLRGTKLARDRDQWGLVENDDPLPQVVQSHTFSREDHVQMAALSGALQATEGAHGSLRELLQRANSLSPQQKRFTPLHAPQVSA